VSVARFADVGNGATMVGDAASAFYYLTVIQKPFPGDSLICLGRRVEVTTGCETNPLLRLGGVA
jgi:hypothetical protein